MIDFGMRDWNHSLSDFNNGEHLMKLYMNYHFADFEENDKFFDWNFSMQCSIMIP